VEDDPRRFGFHSLRHSLASFLVRIRTDPKTVQTLLRHSDVKLTLQFYSHAVSQDRMAAAVAQSVNLPATMDYVGGGPVYRVPARRRS
jgi:integrase